MITTKTAQTRSQIQAWLRRNTELTLEFRATMLGIAMAYGIWEANVDVRGILTHVKLTFGNTEVDAYDIEVGQADEPEVEVVEVELMTNEDGSLVTWEQFKAMVDAGERDDSEVTLFDGFATAPGVEITPVERTEYAAPKVSDAVASALAIAGIYAADDRQRAAYQAARAEGKTEAEAQRISEAARFAR